MRIVENFYWWNCWNWERSGRETYSAFVPCRGLAVCWPLCGTAIRGVVRFIVGVSGYLGLVFSSFIHRVFQFRGNSRRIRCRDSSGAFVPWVSALVLLFQSRRSSASWLLSRLVRLGEDPRDLPSLQNAFRVVSSSFLKCSIGNTTEHREASLFADVWLLTSFQMSVVRTRLFT